MFIFQIGHHLDALTCGYSDITRLIARRYIAVFLIIPELG
jgi:hypothetical protein